MFQGLGCSPIKAVRELGSERRETVRSISGVGVRALRGPFPSTRGPGRTHLWCTSYRAHGVEEPHQCILNLVVKLYCGGDTVGEVPFFEGTSGNRSSGDVVGPVAQRIRAPPGLWNKGVSRTYTGQLTVIFKSPQVGFEPTTNQLTADRSTTELLRNNGRFDLIEFHSRSQPMTNMSSKLPSTLLYLPSPSSRYGRRRRRSREEGISNNWFYYRTAHHVHIDLLCASASSTV
ncbi:hypothetical protein E3N88_25781 [Mikania micrantha]|uniref:Uncharacterized protein n=1 Tax=Mikania micrantha TaxID=192012 RepID=A0A5N6N6M9_9ASTR|nr:hypothetical protein E3N88_25781 [Mikania micrantha]